MSVKGMMINARSAIESLRDLIGTTHQTKSAIAEQLSQAESERRSLLSAPLNRADLEAIILRDIRAQQADALANEELLADIRYTQTSAIKHQLQGDAASSSPFVSGGYSQTMIDRLILAMGDPAEILKRLMPAIDRLDFKTAGPAMADRKTRLSALDKTITGLRADLAEIESVLSNSNPTVQQNVEPKPGERREIAPGRWAVWRYMPHQIEGFWDYEDSPVVLRAAPNQPFN